MLIVDAQVHIWLSGSPYDVHRQQPVFSAENLLAEMDEAGVSRAILLAPRWEPDDNRTTIDAAKRYPDRFAVVRRIPPNAPDSIELFPRLLEPSMLGVRLIFTGGEQPWLQNGTSDWYWPAAERYRIPTMVRVTGGDALDYIGRIAERHPGLPIIIDHLGVQHRQAGPGGIDLTVDDAAFAYQPHLLAMAKLPNVAVKATGATDYSSHPYPHTNIHKYIREIYDNFGPERMLWGSDLSRLRRPYRECVTLFTEELPWLSEHDKELIMGKAFCNWFNWSIQ